MCSARRRILIVDDDEDSLANISDILTEKGYETETARDGRIALQMLQPETTGTACRFDLALLDFKMPIMDGATLYERIQSCCPSLQAIMITAYASDEGLRRAKQAGNLRVLKKPVDVATLLGLIEESVN